MMKIEIIVGESEPENYVLKDSRLSVGKDSTCDIIISDPEISRNHLEIFKEAGKVFFVDKGSMNGTYLNEERITPGKKTEFLSFFPLRLGTNVLISLLDEVDTIAEKKTELNTETTRVVSLKDLKAADTKKLIKKSKSKPIQKVKPKRKFKLTFFNVTAVLIMFAGAAYTLKDRNEVHKKEVAKVAAEASLKEKMKISIPLKTLQDLLAVEKCQNEIESKICASVVPPLAFPWGAKVSDDTAYIQIVGKKYYDEAKALLTKKTEKVVSDFDTWKVASALFLMDGIKSDFNSSLLKDKKMIIAFYSEEQNPKLNAVISILPEALENVKVLLVRRRLDALPEKGTDIIKFTEDYYSVAMSEGTRNE